MASTSCYHSISFIHSARVHDILLPARIRSATLSANNRAVLRASLLLHCLLLILLLSQACNLPLPRSLPLFRSFPSGSDQRFVVAHPRTLLAYLATTESGCPPKKLNPRPGLHYDLLVTTLEFRGGAKARHDQEHHQRIRTHTHLTPDTPSD